MVFIKAVNTIRLAGQWTIVNSLELLTRTPFRAIAYPSVYGHACMHLSYVAASCNSVLYSIIATANYSPVNSHVWRMHAWMIGIDVGGSTGYYH